LPPAVGLGGVGATFLAAPVALFAVNALVNGQQAEHHEVSDQSEGEGLQTRPRERSTKDRSVNAEKRDTDAEEAQTGDGQQITRGTDGDHRDDLCPHRQWRPPGVEHSALDAVLTDEWAAATTGAERSTLVAAGPARLAIYEGPGLGASVLLVMLSTLIVSGIMPRSGVFGRLTAAMGIVAGIIGLAYHLVSRCGRSASSSYAEGKGRRRDVGRRRIGRGCGPAH